MVILITGASHTGKTKLAQELLEMYKYPYLSIDHLKMIRILLWKGAISQSTGKNILQKNIRRKYDSFA